ncbi:MAG TPA: MYXO-CTERM sorting domain-containing protein [Phycisphaerales bacterium]|nr:MYXO-CTERM sorting domain-containing protein [Phycisphaerales bacterium]
MKYGIALAASALALGAGSAIAGPIAVGGAAFKPHPTVTETPSYTTVSPAYFVPGNIVGTLTQPIVGGLQGTVVTTVYQNPANGFLAFDYRFTAAASNPAATVRATLGGVWLPVAVTDAGAIGNGSSGTGDPGAEWTDGDAFFLARSPTDGAPNIQWRAFGLGSALGPGDISSNTWFETNATAFAPAPMAVIDTAITGSSTILAPIPTPGTAALGLVALGLLTRRRR